MINKNFDENSWYSFLDEENRTKILSNSTVVDYNKGETIIKQGIAPKQIPFLEKGMVKLTSTNNNRTTTFKIIAANTFIGLMCAFVKKKFDFSAIAIIPSTVRMIDRSLFEEAIRTNGKFAVHVVHEMSLTTNMIVTELIQLNHKNADGAICTILLELSIVFKSKTFQLPFNRIEFADTVGYSKESVITCLSSLQEQGIIKVSGKAVEIIDLNRLEKIAAYG